jgi:tetratricopeptide (TPR) repeat protein
VSKAPDAALQETLRRAIALIGEGRLDAAQASLEGDGGAALGTAVGQNIRGDIYLKQGRLAEALQAFDMAVRLAPSMPQAHGNRAAVLQEMNRAGEALAAIDRALRLKPDHAPAHFNRGNILRVLHRREEAIRAFDQALRGQPKFIDAMLNRGMVLSDSGRHLQALADFNNILAVQPRHAAALIGRASAFRGLGDYDNALTAISNALAIDPDNIEAVVVHFAILQDAQRYDEALALADRHLLRLPESGRFHTLRALALGKLGRHGEALAAADRAVALAPGDAEARTARTVALCELDRFVEARDEVEIARAAGGEGAAFQQALASVQTGLRDFDAALAAMERSIELEPNLVLAHYNYAFLLLSLRDFRRGFAEHEWRLKMKENVQPRMLSAAPPWRGEGVRGRKLLLYYEQGHGDTIQFTRYVRPLIERGATVTLVVQEALRRLYEANFPGVDVVSRLGARSGFDFQASLMSLAHLFDSTWETVPAAIPYLAADDARVAKWRERLGAGFRIGIVWQGNPKYKRDRTRSFRPHAFGPLAAVPGVRLVSLQTHGPADDLKTLPATMQVETLGEEVVNNPDGFREMAAVMANLDLLVTSDTGPAHLAGALGRPIFVALSDSPDWRWTYEGATTPWYPTMRLFRQETRGDWAGVFERIAAEVAPLAAAVSAGCGASR